jgi:hypothetical protein
MKKLTVHIPDNQYAFFMELVQKLGFVKVEEPEIPEEHKAIVRERMKKSSQNPDRLLDWDQVQDSFRLD